MDEMDEMGDGRWAMGDGRWARWAMGEMGEIDHPRSTAMHAFTVHPHKPPPAPLETKPRRRWRRMFGLLLLLLGVGGVAWAVRPDPHLARARALQKQLFSPASKDLSPEERKARFAEYREHIKHLNDDQKWQLSATMREKQKAEMDRYFAMSSAERTRYLDEQIDRSEKMRQMWKQKAAQGKGNQAKGRPPGGGFGSGGKAGATQSGKGGRPPRSSEEIQQRRKQFLDRTSPEERARMDRFRKDMADRRKQRGLPTRG